MGPSRTGPRKGTMPLMPPTCTLGSPLCFWAVAECTAGTGLLGHPPQQRPECWHQGVEPAQGKAWAAGRRPRLLGSWSTVPPQGPRCEVGAPGPPGALCLPTHSSPLPGQRMPQPWADVACSPKHTHICPFGPRHQQEERGSWRKGRRPLPREGALPTLGVRAYMSVHCRASCRPAHFGTLAWALTCGCRWPSAAAGLVRSHTV